MNLRDEILQRLEREIPSDAVAVVRPNHPFLLRPPDVLVARDHQLLGIFVQSGKDERDDSRLRAKLSLARLALPDGTAIALIAPWVMAAQALGEDFDAIVDPDGSGSLFRAISTSLRQEGVFVEPSVRSAVRQRLAVAGERSQSSERRDVARGSDTDVDRGRRILDLPTGDGSRNRGRFVNEMLTVADEDFVLDRGAPYPRRELAVHTAFGGIGGRRSDPVHLITAAAFAGWELVDVPHPLDGVD